MNIRMWLPALGVFGAAACFAQSAAEPDLGWPVTVSGDDAKIEIYQPQVDSWKSNQLKARSAITLTRDATQRPVYGIASISARTHVDKESRVVTLDNVKIENATFPSSGVDESELLQNLRDTLPQWPQIMSLDRLQASLAITQAESATESAPLKNDPPHIIFSSEPAVLVVVDGEPVYRSVAGSAYSRVINTPALILCEASRERLYLDGGTIWMTATTLAGPWTLAPNAPPELDAIRAGLAKQEDIQPDDGHPASPAVPRVYVSTSPAELLQTQGGPRFSPLPKTTLLYASNSNTSPCWPAAGLPPAR